MKGISRGGVNATLSLTTGAAGPRLFTIHQIDANTNNLPKAHTWWVSPVCSRTRCRKSSPLNRQLVFSPQLQSDWHSTLRGLRQAIRQAADGDWGDLWLCGGMRRTEEHSSCLQSSSSLIYALPFTVRSAAAIFIFYSLFLCVLFLEDKFKIRHEWAEFAFRTTRCSIISFPVNAWSRFQFHLHFFGLFFLLNPLDSQLNWFCATESWTLQVAISCHW